MGERWKRRRISALSKLQTPLKLFYLIKSNKAKLLNKYCTIEDEMAKQIITHQKTQRFVLMPVLEIQTIKNKIANN